MRESQWWHSRMCRHSVGWSRTECWTVHHQEELASLPLYSNNSLLFFLFASPSFHLLLHSFLFLFFFVASSASKKRSVGKICNMSLLLLLLLIHSPSFLVRAFYFCRNTAGQRSGRLMNGYKRVACRIGKKRRLVSSTNHHKHKE